MRRLDWADYRTTEYANIDPERTIAILPTAAIEQHGPHLPVGVDTMIAEGMLAELRTIVAGAGLTRCRFHSNHASNYVPLSLNLPADRERGLALLDAVLARRRQDDLKPEFLRGL